MIKEGRVDRELGGAVVLIGGVIMRRGHGREGCAVVTMIAVLVHIRKGAAGAVQRLRA